MITKVCEECKHPISTDDIFCLNCGAIIYHIPNTKKKVKKGEEWKLKSN